MQPSGQDDPNADPMPPCEPGDVSCNECFGICEPPYCFADSDCPKGQTCIFDDATCGGVPGDTPTWCGGYCSEKSPPSDCIRTGCSLELCSDQRATTPCDYLPEYACYDLAVCERQADGARGWTMTPDAEQCFADSDSLDPGNP